MVLLLATQPFVSILVPVRNEARYVERCLTSVFAQDYPKYQIEILVSDGMSADRTREIVTSFQDRHPNLHLLDNPGRITPTALNTALLYAQGEIIVRVDGHCQIAPDYIRRCVEHLLNDGVDGVGGAVVTVGETFLAQAIAAAMSSPFGVGNSAFRTVSDKTIPVDSVPFPAYTRAIIERAGLYDEELVRNQDDEYNYRLRKLGARILLAADVHSTYYSRSTFRSLWKQFFQYGFWKVRVLQKHPRQMRPRQFIPPAFVATLLGSGLLALWTHQGRYLLALVAGMYIFANLIVSARTAANMSWKYLPLLFIAFPTLHISYGLGFLAGLVRFGHRWNDHQGQVPRFNQTLT